LLAMRGRASSSELIHSLSSGSSVLLALIGSAVTGRVSTSLPPASHNHVVLSPFVVVSTRRLFSTSLPPRGREHPRRVALSFMAADERVASERETQGWEIGVWESLTAPSILVFSASSQSQRSIKTSVQNFSACASFRALRSLPILHS